MEQLASRSKSALNPSIKKPSVNDLQALIKKEEPQPDVSKAQDK